MNVTDYKNFIKGRCVSVIGIGVSNVPLIRFLTEAGAVVTAHDKKNKEQLGDVCDELTALGTKLVLGEGYLKDIPQNTEVVFKTPGLRIDVPELVEAAEKGITITSEMELFFELCPGQIIAITGSDGKTTTTTLIGEMLKNSGYNCYIGGNIGKPLIDEVEKMTADDKIVLELSSFQLHSMKHRPDIAVVTNVTPNHLDWHTDFDEYVNAKKNIFQGQKAGGRVILNYDNQVTRDFAKSAQAPIFFSRNSGLESGVFLQGDAIVRRTDEGMIEEILNIRDIRIPGMHNVENYMAAIAAVYDMVGKETINHVAKGFNGVPHRIEFVREIDGARYYNDSIASSPARTTAGLKSFDKKVILIAGGYDKKIPFDEFGSVINGYVKKLILVGATSEKIYTAVKNADNYDGLEIFRESEFEGAVNKARECAQKGDVVILSPACASFDLFKNFEERGNTFKRIINNF